VIQEKWLFVTFGDGSEEIRASARRLASQAEGLRAFSLVLNYDFESLSQISTMLGSEFKSKAISTPGFGFWRWKPVLLRALYERHLKDSEEFAGIVYLDAGCEIPQNKTSSYFMRRMMRLTFNQPVISAETNYLEKMYSKREVIQRIGVDDITLSSRQIQATWMLLRKSNITEDLLHMWSHLAIEDDGYYFDNRTLDEDDFFIAHRHDQSVYSLLYKKLGFVSYKFAYYNKFGSMRNSFFPIWTMRNRSGRSSMKKFVNWNIVGFLSLFLHVIFVTGNFMKSKASR
jgi:hypothetical protein